MEVKTYRVPIYIVHCTVEILKLCYNGVYRSIISFEECNDSGFSKGVKLFKYK